MLKLKISRNKFLLSVYGGFTHIEIHTPVDARIFQPATFFADFLMLERNPVCHLWRLKLVILG